MTAGAHEGWPACSAPWSTPSSTGSHRYGCAFWTAANTDRRTRRGRRYATATPCVTYWPAPENRAWPAPTSPQAWRSRATSPTPCAAYGPRYANTAPLCRSRPTGCAWPTPRWSWAWWGHRRPHRSPRRAWAGARTAANATPPPSPTTTTPATTSTNYCSTRPWPTPAPTGIPHGPSRPWPRPNAPNSTWSAPTSDCAPATDSWTWAAGGVRSPCTPLASTGRGCTR